MSRVVSQTYCTECEWSVNRHEVGRKTSNELLLQHYRATSHSIDTREILLEPATTSSND